MSGDVGGPLGTVSDYDIANLRYLASNQVPHMLEKAVRGLLQDRPARPLDHMIKTLTELKAQGRRALEEDRDESVRSESSAFSVNSVDMSDFLHEFRQVFVHQMRTRSVQEGEAGRVTKRDLGDAIDQIAFPVPEKMLTDMFNEIDIDNEGTVEFEVLVARVNYKIQGTFSSETIKCIYRTVASDNNVIRLPECASAFHKLAFPISERELEGLCGTLRADPNAITPDDFVRLVQTHTGSLPPPVGMTAFNGSNDDNRDLDDD